MEKYQEVLLALQRFVRQIQNGLTQPSSDDQVTELLQSLLYISSTRNKMQSTNNLILANFPGMDINQVKAEFCSHHYANLLEFLVVKFSVEWMSLIPKGDAGTKLIDAVFLEGYPHLALTVLGESISSTR
jgi:hypothetical protein